jgi:hypothetical protein
VKPPGELAPGELDLVDEAEAIFAEMPDEPLTEARFAALLGQVTPETLWLGMAKSTVRLDLTERATGETWPVSATVHRMGLATSFSAEIDPNTLAAGVRLADGLWDLYLHYGVLGLAMRRRTTLTAERRPGHVLPEPVKNGLPTMAAYFTRRTSGLSLDIGLIKHPKLRAQPKRAPARKAPFARRAVRKLHRMLNPS